MKRTDPMLPNWSCWLLSFLQGKCSLYEPGCSQCPWKPLLRRCYFNIWRAVISFHKDSLFHRRNKHRIWQMQGRSEIFLCGGTERPIKLSCVPCIMVSGALDVFSENWFCGVTNSQLIILFLFLNTLCECHRMQRGMILCTRVLTANGEGYLKWMHCLLYIQHYRTYWELAWARRRHWKLACTRSVHGNNERIWADGLLQSSFYSAVCLTIFNQEPEMGLIKQLLVLMLLF